MPNSDTAPAKERYFLVECEIRTGEEEYTTYSHYVTDGEDYTDEDYMKEWLGDDLTPVGDDEGEDETQKEFLERTYNDGFWIDEVRMINHFIIKEATKAEYKVLQKFI